MSEPKFSGPVPATPVAKAMETPVPQRTPIAPAPEPMTQQQREQTPGFIEPAKPKPKRVRKKKSEKLSAKEIKALNAKRAAALATKRKKAKRPGRPVGSKNKPKVAKNPNRPLELKHRLDVVLSLSQQLRRPDMNVFVDLMKQLERLNRGTRVKVLAGLEQVFA